MCVCVTGRVIYEATQRGMPRLVEETHDTAITETGEDIQK